MSAERPVTSKARGICRYYATPHGCFAGNNCKFLHGEQEKLTPFDKSKPCRFYAAGYCKRGAKCWFVHAQPVASGSRTPNESNVEDESDNLCSICYDTPVTYGLLAGCSHIFCLGCIKGWRDPRDKSMDVIASGVIKTCPMCRAPSKFITPSSIFFAQDHPGKAAIIEQYKASMARVPCRFFQESPPTERYCPFGNDCFYQHQNEDGSTHEFTKGVEYYIRQWRRSQHADTYTTERYGMSILASLQAALDRFRTSIEGLQGVGDIPEEAFDAHTIIASEIHPDVVTNDVSPPVPRSVVSALAEDVLSSFVAPPSEAWISHPPRIRPLTAVSFEETMQRIPEVEDSSPTNGTERLVPIQSEHLNVYDNLQRPPEVVDWLLPNDGDPIARIGEDITALDYGSDEPVTIPEDNRTEHFTVSVPPVAQMDDATAEHTTDLTPEPSFQPTTAPVSGSSLQHPVEALVDAPVVVHDSDPPFMTDGRGRVVWSSTTGQRGRRRRTSTSIPGGAPAPAAVLPVHREKPRDGGSNECVPDRSPERRLAA